MRESLKNAFMKDGWRLTDERIEEETAVMNFATEKAGAFETMAIKLGFTAGEGTYLTLEYKWPPCSTER